MIEGDEKEKDVWHHLGNDLYINQSAWERRLGMPIKIECDLSVCLCRVGVGDEEVDDDR